MDLPGLLRGSGPEPAYVLTHRSNDRLHGRFRRGTRPASATPAAAAGRCGGSRACAAPRIRRAVRVAPASQRRGRAWPTRRSWTTTSGSHAGNAGSRTSVSNGASGSRPSRIWTASGNAVAFHNCGVFACGYAPGVGESPTARSRRRTPGYGTRGRVARGRTVPREIVHPRVETETSQAEQRSSPARPPTRCRGGSSTGCRTRGRRERADSPAAEHVRREQTADDGRKMVGVDDAASRGNGPHSTSRRSHQPLVGIHREREERCPLTHQSRLNRAFRLGRALPKYARASPRSPSIHATAPSAAAPRTSSLASRTSRSAPGRRLPSS